MTKQKLTIAFESEKLTYSDLDVDLYNTGITQILSVAASRGHDLYHFSMSDLYRHDGAVYTRASVLRLPEKWEGDPVTAHRYLTKAFDRPLKLSDIDICFARGDDIRNADSPNVDLLKELDERRALMESLDATFYTTDKYELTKRLPDTPQPMTFACASPEDAYEAIGRLPKDEGYFVVKDRFGYGCGMQVHRVRFDDPELDQVIAMYLSKYTHILIQEFCPEVKNGDIVVTFFDGELIAPMFREPAYGQWKTNLSFGANQVAHALTREQEQIARTVISAFPEIRYASVDMLSTGKVIEINAYPGGQGLYQIYGVSVGAIIMDKLESELLAKEPPPAIITAPVVEQPMSPWNNVEELYRKFNEQIPVFDVFGRETYYLYIQDLIDFTPRSNDYILSIPHSGVLVPEAFKDRFDLGDECLKEIDLLSDVLYEGLDGLQVVSRLAPFFVDMNRTRNGFEAENLPKHLTNPATEYHTIKDEKMLKQPYTGDEFAHIIRYYDLYHNIIYLLAENMIRERGYALIIDAHSMSSVGWGRVYDEGRARSNFVVGTLDDKSADSEIIHSFCQALDSVAQRHRLGLTTAKNEPYSGGFITRKHNDPDSKVHVIQLEVTMDTYMYEAVEKDKSRRYALKQPRLKMVQDIVCHAIETASLTARRIYS
jgi:glutathione synthase/RimK-type ligase-like ATP-grasp enzyme/N-formylglutamate amidohydrolase